MKRDAWYAVIAALGLSAIAGGYGLWNAGKLANPSIEAERSKLTASLPSPPNFEIDDNLLSTAQEILRLRDPFVERDEGDEISSRGLNLPKLAPPVRFSDPNEQILETEPVPGIVQNIPPTTAGLGAPLAQQKRQRGSLTLRGVFPSATGGRAMVAMPDGRIVNVVVGGVVGGWRVLEIRQGAIRLGRGQRTILLAMPR